MKIITSRRMNTETSVFRINSKRVYKKKVFKKVFDRNRVHSSIATVLGGRLQVCISLISLILN